MSWSETVIGKKAHAVSHMKKHLKDLPAVAASVEQLASTFADDQGLRIETFGHIGRSAHINIESQSVVDTLADENTE